VIAYFFSILLFLLIAAATIGFLSFAWVLSERLVDWFEVRLRRLRPAPVLTVEITGDASRFEDALRSMPTQADRWTAGR
jgi:hypothetical protein